MTRGTHLFRLPPELRGPTERLKVLLQADERDEVTIGTVLREVHKRLPHSNFLGWLDAELPITHARALRYIAVAAKVRGR
jgi:hypothetical protein